MILQGGVTSWQCWLSLSNVGQRNHEEFGDTFIRLSRSDSEHIWAPRTSCWKLVSSYERVQACDMWRSKCCCWLKTFDQVGLWPPWNLGRFSKVNLEPTVSPQATLVFPCVRNHPKLLSQDTSVLIICTAYFFWWPFFSKKGLNTIQKKDLSQPPLMPWVGERHDIDYHGLNFWYFLWLVQGWEMLQFMLWESNRDLHVFCVRFED